MGFPDGATPANLDIDEEQLSKFIEIKIHLTISGKDDS